MFFNPAKPVSSINRAVEMEYGYVGESLIRSAMFGTAKDAAAFLDSFDYGSGDVFGWTGDTATMQAMDSYRKDKDMRALPEFITEIDRVRGTEEIVGADEFATLKNMFRRDREYKVRRYELPDRSTVHAVFFVGKDREGNSQNKLSSYLWHVPEGMEYPIG